MKFRKLENPMETVEVFDYDIDVDEDGLMWLVEEDDWKSAAKDTAMSDMKEDYMDDEWISIHDKVFSKRDN
jgi:hypothetical protein